LLRVYTWYTGKREVTRAYYVCVIIVLISVSLLVIIIFDYVFPVTGRGIRKTERSNNNSE